MATLAGAISLCAANLETRHNETWPTTNHYRTPATINVQAGHPVLFEDDLLRDANPDSIRVLAPSTSEVLPAKVEWRSPRARVSWLSTGPGTYFVYFDRSNSGETQRLVEPAMIGTGDRMTFGRAKVRARLAVGLYSYPVAVDLDSDGKTDLIVGCPDRPYNGIYYFRNIGTNDTPLFDKAVWLGPGGKDLVAADFNGDGKIDLVISGGYYDDVRTNLLSKFVPVTVPRKYHIGRDDLWYPADWDHDGKIDLLIGVSDWRDYGWDDAWDSHGQWSRGPLHGYIYFHKNIGTNQNPVYAEPVLLSAGGRPIDQYGSPIPNPVDWFGAHRLDLIAGNFMDTITVFRNNGQSLENGLPLRAGKDHSEFRADICMIQPRVAQWHPDGRPSLVVGEEGGMVTLLENLAPNGKPPVLAEPKYLDQIDPDLKSLSLNRPVAVDWNGDGKLDILSGNSAGYIQYFENVGSRQKPEFVDRGYLEAGGKIIRNIAGPNGSVQGPAERKWGYTNISVADWDLDGKLDIVVNDIWGKVVWYRNIGSRTNPRLAAAQDIEVEWNGPPPKPDWVWWTPGPKQLVTQWRTTPKVVDWNRDGLPDLVMLDPRGYLVLYPRTRSGGKLKLMPPQPIFLDATGRFLYLSEGRAGRSGRRNFDIVDWDGDGDLDLVIETFDGIGWYENTGTQEKPVMVWRGELTKRKIPGHNPAPAVADWNGDGRLDLIAGAEDGHFYYFERSFIDGR